MKLIYLKNDSNKKAIEKEINLIDVKNFKEAYKQININTSYI